MPLLELSPVLVAVGWTGTHWPALVLFVGTALLTFYTFAGYPLLIRCIARNRPPLDAPPVTNLPVSIVLVVHNEEARIVARLQNLADTDYPADAIEVIVVSDGSTDRTVEIARSCGLTRLTVIPLPERSGKAAGLNAALASARGEVIVFADARQRFNRQTLPHLLRWYALPNIGAVSGDLTIESATSQVGGAVSSYWAFEKKLRIAEARIDSCIGCTGAVYSIRRSLYVPIPPDTLLDDVVIPMHVATQGYRVLHDPESHAYDPQSLEPDREVVRKRRTLAGNFQMLFRHPAWLLPWRNRLWLQLASHKYCRVLAPFFLCICYAANALLLTVPGGKVAFAVQTAFYLLGIAGLVFPGLRLRIFSLPAGFLLLNLSAVSGFWHYLRGSHTRLWQPAALTTPGSR